MTQGKKDPQAGEKLFKALRELEVQFLNGGYSVQTSIQGLLKSHEYSPANQMAKYLLEQSVIKKDPNMGSHKRPYYWYNGPRLSVKYCNDLILAMRLDRSSRKTKPKLPPGYVDHLEVLTDEARIKEQANEIKSLKDRLDVLKNEKRVDIDGMLNEAEMEYENAQSLCKTWLTVLMYLKEKKNENGIKQAGI